MRQQEMYLQKQTLASFIKMREAAEKDGIQLTIVSGARDFYSQKSIWERKYKSNNEEGLSDIENIKKIMLWSSMPSTSRHHWGTDIDVYDPDKLGRNQQLSLSPWEYQKDGPFNALSEWLQQHANQFGFYLPYDEYRGGVAQEPWHLSYYPIAQELQEKLNGAKIAKAINSGDVAGRDNIIAHLDQLLTQYVVNVGEVPDG